jgi:hypothetical protein
MARQLGLSGRLEAARNIGSLSEDQGVKIRGKGQLPLAAEGTGILRFAQAFDWERNFPHPWG